MKTKTKLWVFTLFACLLMSSLVLSTNAAKIIAQEKAVDNGYGTTPAWTLYDDGTLRIYGAKEIYMYYSPMFAKNYETRVTKLIVDDAETVSLCYMENFINMTEIMLPESLQSLEYRFFSGCSKVESITIPKNVSYFDGSLPVGTSYSDKCSPTSIKNIYVDSGNKYYKSIDGVLFSKDGTPLVRYPDGRTETTYIVPSSVKTIARGAFERSDSLKNIVLPDSITEIESEAFSGCKGLQTIQLPANLKKIYTSTESFKGCISLTALYIDENNPYYFCENGVLFTKDKKTLLLFPYGLQKDNYIVPASVTTIGRGAFAYINGVESIVIPENVSKIESGAFLDADSLYTIYIPRDTKIDLGAFGDPVMSSGKCDNLTIHGFYNSDAYKTATGENCGEMLTFPFVEMTESEYREKLSNILIKGDLGNGITYTLSNDYVLTISDTGEAPELPISASTPLTVVRQSAKLHCRIQLHISAILLSQAARGLQVLLFHPA